jgi:cysteine desulfurase
LEKEFANPESLHAAGRGPREALEAARGRVARVLGAKPHQITFTSGATESINLALQGILRRFPGAKAVASSIEHQAVRATLRGLAEEGFDYQVCPVDGTGLIDLDQLAAAIDERTVLVSVGLANSEVGTVQPLRRLVSVIERKRSERQPGGWPLYLHTDASAAPGFLNIHNLGVDLLSLNGSKVYGPPGSGCLLAGPGIELKPLIYGGGQERGLRSGTINVAAAVGFAAALTLAEERREGETLRLAKLRDELQQALQKALPNFALNGHPARRLPPYLNFRLPGLDGEMAVLRLSEAGVMVATGAACGAASHEPSPVLLALGLSIEEANSSLRITLGRPTTATEIHQATEKIVTVCTQLASGKP